MNLAALARRAVVVALSQVIALQPLALYPLAALAQQDGGEGVGPCPTLPLPPPDQKNDDCTGGACEWTPDEDGATPEEANPPEESADTPDINGEQNGDDGSGDAARGDPGGDDFNDGYEFGGVEGGVDGGVDIGDFGWGDSGWGEEGGGWSGGGGFNFLRLMLARANVDATTDEDRAGNEAGNQHDAKSADISAMQLPGADHRDASFDQTTRRTSSAPRGFDRSIVLAAGDLRLPGVQVADPIDTRTGNKRHVQIDYRSGGAAPLKLARVYISLPSEDQAARRVNFGLGWRTNYDRSLQYDVASAAPRVSLHRPNGVVLTYTLSGGQWISPAAGGVLTQTTSGWQYINHRNAVEDYDASGRLVALSRSGRTTTLSYDAYGRLSQVSNPFGRTLQFNYDMASRVASVTLPGDSTLQYTYNASGALAGVTFADGTTRQYLYEVAADPRLLTGIVDEAGRRYVTWGYDSAGRVISSEFAGATNRLAIAYGSTQTITTDHRGVQRIREFENTGGQRRLLTLRTQRAGVDLVPKWDFNYDAAGTLRSLTTRRGERRAYLFDGRGRALSVTRAAGTSEAVTRTRQWHPQFRIPTQVAFRGVTTTHAVDAAGRITESTRTGIDGLSVSTRSVYNAQGLRSQFIDPSGQITSFTYDAAGNVATITRPSGHITRFVAHNAHGQPTEIQLPSGRLIGRSYDARGRLIAHTVAGRVIRYQYDAAGRVTRITRPDGRYHAYAYDGARRLLSVTNERGARLTYTRDAAGEVTAAAVTDALGNVVAQRSRELDVLGRTTALVGAAGQRTTVSYNGIGDPVQITDPLNTPMQRSFDFLGRKKEVTVAGTETTRVRFDERLNLTSVTDPLGA